MRRIVLLLLLSALLPAGVGVPRTALAQTGPAVQALVDQAQAEFKSARYAEALRSYGRALAAGAPRELRFMLGRCHQMLEQWREAREVYQILLADADTPSHVRIRTEAELAAVEARLEVGTLVLQIAPFGALVFIDGRPVGAAPLDPRVLPAGRHHLRVTADGREAVERSIELEGGVTTPLAIELRVAEAPRPPDSPAPEPPAFEPPRPRRTAEPVVVVEELPVRGSSTYSPWTWVTLGTGIAALAGGGLAYGLGEKDHQDVIGAEGYAEGGPVVGMTQQRAADLEESGDTKKLAGSILFGVGGALVVTSTVLFVLDATAGPDDGTVTVGVLPTPHGGVLSVEGRF
jgi:hypothetical protein